MKLLTRESIQQMSPPNRIMKEEETFSLIQECTNEYLVENFNKEEVEIRIRIPKKFRSLWLSKLSDLRTTEKEIEEYKNT